MKLLVGLIGAGIQRSLAPALHEEEARHHGLRLHYQLIDLDAAGAGAEALAGLLGAARIMGFAGLNITYPCKQAVMPLLDLAQRQNEGWLPKEQRPGALASWPTELFPGALELIDRIPRRYSVEAGISGSVAMRRRPGPYYDIEYFLTPLNTVAKETKHMVPEYIENGNIWDIPCQVAMPSATQNEIKDQVRQKILPALTRHFIGEVEKIAKALPNDRIAIQWDVCQEVLAWHDYYDKGLVPFETETIEVLTQIGDAVPSGVTESRSLAPR